MNRVINWVFGSFFRTLGRVLCYLGIGILIGIVMNKLGLFLEVKAETINNVSSSINQSCSTNGRFTYSLYGSNFDSFSTGSFKTKYNGVADYFVFDLDYDLLGNASYQLSISAISTDFRNINKSNVFIESSSGCATPTGLLDIINVSFSKSKIVINFKTTSNISRFMVTLGDKGGPAITGISTFGISSIDITTIESNDTQNIIDNQNQNANSIIDNQQQNTQDIIDNQNKNNEELKDTINDNFNSCTKGDLLIDFSNPYKNLNVEISDITNNSVKLSNSSGWSNITYRIPVSKNSIYNFNFTLTGNSGISSVGFSSTSSTNYDLKLFSNIDTTNGYNLTFTYNNTNLDYIYISFTPYNNNNNTGITYFDIVNNSSSYEACSNKLDDTNDKLDNLTGAITDSTPPNVDDLGNAAGWLPPGPVDTIANLPITFFQTLLGKINKSCKPIELELPFVKQNLILPCASSILSQLGNFNGWWEAFGFIAAAWCLYKYFINFYKWVESALSLDEKESLGKWGGV